MQSILNTPYIGKILRRFDGDIGRRGLQPALKYFLEQFNARVEISGMTDDLKDILQNKSVVIVSNHPTETEPFVLISTLPKRKDFYLIINSKYAEVCKNAAKYLIPVYIDHHIKKEKFSARVISYIFDTLHQTSHHSEQDAHAKNIASIKRASEKLSQGSSVLIFPGRRSIDGHWFNGVGFMVHGFKGQQDLYQVNVNILGTHRLDYLRLTPLVNRLFPTLKVKYSAPRRINNLVNKNAKEITRSLEEDYVKWETALN